MGVQARTLEIYSRLGLAQRAIELGRRGNGANLWANGKWRARVPVGEIGKSLSPFPFVLLLGQDDNERIMGEKLRDWGMTVQWHTELLTLGQQTDCVTAVLKQPDGTTREVTAAYVAGCDGARSAVRELSGITFPGAPYEHVFFVADTEAIGPMVQEELNIYMWRDAQSSRSAGAGGCRQRSGLTHCRVVGECIAPPPQPSPRRAPKREGGIPSAALAGVGNMVTIEVVRNRRRLVLAAEEACR